MSLIFEWDDIKAIGNIKKHSVSFDEAKTVFDDPFARLSEDWVHSIKENRWYIIGFSKYNRLIITCFTERNERIRIISARKATSSERKRYEKFKE